MSPKASDLCVKANQIILKKAFASAKRQQVTFRSFSYTIRNTERTKILYFWQLTFKFI